MKRPKIHDKRLIEIKARAVSEFGKYKCSVPVNLMQLVKQAGQIKLHLDDYGDAFDGAIEYDEDPDVDEYHIFINTRVADLSQPRGRFTLAHELGHYFIIEHAEALSKRDIPRYKYPTVMKSSAFAEVLAESEADCFAVNLLVPENELKMELGKAVKAGRRVSKGLVGELADHFQVSFQCAASKVLENTKELCAFVVFPKNHLRVPWVEVSNSFELKFGLSRDSKLQPHPPFISGNSSFLDHWFRGVIHSAKERTICAEVIHGSHDDCAFLTARD